MAPTRDWSVRRKVPIKPRRGIFGSLVSSPLFPLLLTTTTTTTFYYHVVCRGNPSSQRSCAEGTGIEEEARLDAELAAAMARAEVEKKKERRRCLEKKKKEEEARIAAELAKLEAEREALERQRVGGDGRGSERSRRRMKRIRRNRRVTRRVAQRWRVAILFGLLIYLLTVCFFCRWFSWTRTRSPATSARALVRRA